MDLNNVDDIIKQCKATDTFFGGGSLTESRPQAYATLHDDLVRRLGRGDEPFVVTLPDGGVNTTLLSHKHLKTAHGNEIVRLYPLSQVPVSQLSLQEALQRYVVVPCIIQNCW
jgi:hypothetical protein